MQSLRHVPPPLISINSHFSPITNPQFTLQNHSKSNVNKTADYQTRHHQMTSTTQPRSHQMVKAATAVTAGGSLLVLSGLTLAGTVVALTLATPLLVIFSPVLVPAAITMFMVSSGFLASGGFGVAAVSVLSWIYRYVTGKHPMGADQLDRARGTLAMKAREMKDKAEQLGGQHQTS